MPKLSPDVYQTYFHVISDSPLFDEKYYAALANISGDRAALVKHYIEVGESSDLTPSEEFDPAFYALGNPDVKSAGANRLYHYIAHGRAEGRFGNKDQVREAAKLIKKEGFFNEAYYKGLPDVIIPDLDPCEEQLALWRLDLNPNAKFDCAFYANFYPDCFPYGKSPMHHYLEVGKAQCRVTNLTDYELLRNLIEPHLDKRFYISNAPHLSAEDDLVRHYISRGVFEGLNPNREFSLDYYLRTHKDIITCGSFPFVHYVLHGRGEGRKAYPDFSNMLKKGGMEFDKAKPTLIIANHEASRTGAPLVGLNLARTLSEKYNIITLLGAVKGIYEFFHEYSCAILTVNVNALDGEYLLKFLKKEYGASGIILNSAETAALAQSATNENFPAVALVHEFSEYTKPMGKISEIVRLVDHVVVPARLVEESVQNEVYLLCSNKAGNVGVAAQGALPWLPSADSSADLSAQDIIDYLSKIAPGKTKIVLGGGYVQIRKGVDLFVQTAYEVSKHRDDVAFFWVGEGYSPEHDLGYSIWIKEMIARMGLEKTVHFFPSQSTLSAFYEISQIFFLSSRLDPFPNVIVDALGADKLVVCFDKATGCADMFHSGQALGAAVPHCDVAAAASAVLSLLDTPQTPGVNAKLVEQNFNFESYAALLDAKLSQAIEERAKQAESAAYLSAADVFDPVFYTGSPTGALMAQPALHDYVASSSKGLTRRSPLRGFNENLFYAKHGAADGKPALERALREAQGDKSRISTHVSHELGNPLNRAPLPKTSQKVLLHIHAHYPDEVAGFVQRLNRSQVKLDLIATATSPENFSHVEFLLSKFTGGKAVTRLVRNVGRDVGPFLTEVPETAKQGSYDIVGHVHTKKSFAWSAVAGASWKDYLLDTLIGNDASTLKEIVALFARDEKLGLIFPEDGNNIGWSSNLDHARELAARLGPDVKIPERPMFPIGNMFWARPGALKPLWDLNLSNSDFPSEPVPYDGTLLHAIERMTPTVCELAGYKWETVYVDGVLR